LLTNINICQQKCIGHNILERLKGFQRKYLKGLAHHIKPVVFIGQKGFTNKVAKSVDDALNSHELIKVKFIEFKEKEQKKDIAEAIEKNTESEMVGFVGHVAIFFRQHKDPEKQKIRLPET
jgi:RNA-binding protein